MSNTQSEVVTTSERNYRRAISSNIIQLPIFSGAVGMRRLTNDQVELIRTSRFSDTHWSRTFGVDRSTVERARKGITHYNTTVAPRLQASRGGWKVTPKICTFNAALIALPNEEWRPVVGWEQLYRVSSLGRIYSLHNSGRFMKGSPVRTGHLRIQLRDSDRDVREFLHRLVLEAFIGPAPEGLVGCHGRNGVTDNSLVNLRWDTQKGNQADRLLDGTDCRGAKCVSAVLTEDIVRQIRSSTISAYAWAKRLGVDKSTVLDVRHRRTWRNV